MGVCSLLVSGDNVTDQLSLMLKFIKLMIPRKMSTIKKSYDDHNEDDDGDDDGEVGVGGGR